MIPKSRFVILPDDGIGVGVGVGVGIGVGVGVGVGVGAAAEFIGTPISAQFADAKLTFHPNVVLPA